MRLGMVLMWAVALVSSVLVGTAESYKGQIKGNRDKTRTTRGFKPIELSTARGFGKRGVNSDFISQSEPQYLERDSFPADWFADELQNNGELARMVVNKFIDTNQDGELTADELLRPVYLNDKTASMYK